MNFHWNTKLDGNKKIKKMSSKIIIKKKVKLPNNATTNT